MKTRIQKWGNSLAVRIPKNLAHKAGLREGSSVEISFQDGQIRIKPVYHYELSDLLAQLTDENKYGEIDTGETQGNEAI